MTGTKPREHQDQTSGSSVGVWAAFKNHGRLLTSGEDLPRVVGLDGMELVVDEAYEGPVRYCEEMHDAVRTA